MCEQTTVDYNPGDVVWVKLGPCWWPGEVVLFEELPSDITESFKKPPLAVVKFFDEEKYEFVKQLAYIHSYNSNRKYEFIKKGMDLYRAKHSFMEKFRGDVCSAEKRTGGNPNILDDPRVAPDKKTNYSSIFGSPVDKKGMKESPRGRARSSIGKLQSPTSPKKVFSLITHPRFLGNDDSKIKLLVQTPSPTKIPDTEYQCYTCDFKANRIEVIILHNKSHLRRVHQTGSPKKTKKNFIKKSKKRRSSSKAGTFKDAVLTSDHSTVSSGTESDESDDEPLVKKKPKAKTLPKPKKQKPIPLPEVKKQTDICSDLLAEWDDDDDEEEPASTNPETTITEPEDSKSDSQIDIEPPKIEEKSNKSCFDFVEDEEDVVTTLEGRRLPRVIPPTDKRKSSIHELEKEISAKSRSTSPQISETPESTLEILKSSMEIDSESNENDATKKRDSQFQLEFEAFNNALKEIVAPDIPSIDKSEQNFHNAKTIKFPDKPNIELELTDTSPYEKATNSEHTLKIDETRSESKNEEPDCKTETSTTITKEVIVKNTEVATKLTNPKKRFVKTFEDETKNSTAKESTLNEQKQEASPEEQKTDSTGLEVAKLKTQLMKKLGDASPKKENTKHAEKSKKFLPKSKKLKITSETTRRDHAEDKSNKRSIVESKNDFETRPHVKRKRFSVEYKDSAKESIQENQIETQHPKSDVEDKDEEFIKDNRVTLENINSSTSSSSLLSEMNVDDEELLNANVLSESQKLTIQNIIGVNSPILTVAPSTVEKSNIDNSIKTNLEKEKVLVLDSVDNTSKPEEYKQHKNETDLEDISKTKSEIIDQSLNMELEQPITDIEENIGNIRNNEIRELTDKLSTKISEHLPEEIIEKSSETVMDAPTEPIIEELKEDATPTTDTHDVVDKDIRKPKEDPIKKVSEEKFEKFLEKKFEKSIKEKSEKSFPEEKFEKFLEEKFEKSIEKSEKTVKESFEKSLEVNLEKSIEENFEESLEVKMDIVIEKEPEKIEKMEKVIEEIPIGVLQENSLSSDAENNSAISTEIQSQKELAENREEPLKSSEIENVTGIEKQKQSMNIPKNEQIEDGNEELPSSESNNKKEIEISLGNVGTNKNDLVKSIFSEEEMVNIEGNLTVVTEKDLADKQVEITTTPEVSKPITLSSFSMDFCEDVESYIKADDVIHTYPKSGSVSPITIKEKPEQKDDTPEDVSGQDIKVDKTIFEKMETESLSQTEDNSSINTSKIEINQDAEKENLLDIQNSVQVETTEQGSSKTKNLLKFDDVTNSAHGDLTKVITESVNKEINLAENIDSKVQSILEKCSQQKALIHKENDKLQKEQNTQELAKEVIQKEEIIIPPVDISVESEVAKITDSLIEQEVVIQDSHQNTTSRKLLEILTDKPKSTGVKSSSVLAMTTQTEQITITSGKQTYKHRKFVTRSSMPGPSRSPKATILEDKLIKPLDESKTVSVKKVTSKRSYQDVEDIDTYIIQKPAKKLNISMEQETTPKMVKKPIISKGKARILQQTIITPTGDILQPPVNQAQTDDNMFDINSMPIVLSDQILTPEGIENMQIVLQENTPKPPITSIKKSQINTTPQVKLLNKTHSPASMAGLKETVLKTSTTPKSYVTTKPKLQKVYPSSSSKVLKSNTSVITQAGKQGKFIIVPASTTPTGTKYTVGKRPAIVKKPPPQKVVTSVNKVPDVPITSSGNKIMILKGQGQQQKILLTTPQKSTPTKLKGRPIGQKQILAKEPQQSKGANIISQTIVNSKGQVTTLANQGVIGNRGQIIASMAQQSRNIKIDPTKIKRAPQQRVYVQSEITKPSTSGQQRTIIIKNPQGQTVKKIQGTDDALLDQQVAQQLQAISRASANQQLRELSSKTTTKLPLKKPYSKKQEMIKQPVGTKGILQTNQPITKNVTIPPLAPISPVKKVETQFTESAELNVTEEKREEVKRPPHQLVIQDAQGNQTTITEGQILALPSEAIDGQAHSYVLVTLDETGNLTPLNSEALMSLDPNLNLTSDLGNMVLQIDQGATTESETKTHQQSAAQEQIETTTTQIIPLKETAEKASVDNVLLPETPAPEPEQNVQAVINSRDMGQLIITGDAATAQKFLESLAEGNTELANLLANADGNVLIQADGQQILINTDSENPMLVMNPESMSNENSEGSGNPIFASQPVKNQDILAAALADTDVFQQDQSISHSPSKVAQSQLSPNSTLYPMNVGNVLETNSMSSPIMTPLEVPSTNSKKIDDENEILTQVPKNVDLPITITDPNISQTVAQQQLLATEIATNLDLPLAIQDPGISVTSTEMSSPSFVYSLPTLDETVDISQKAFSGSISMPLLTEEPEDSIAENSNSSEVLFKDDIEENDKKNKSLEDDKRDSKAESSQSEKKSIDKKIESDEKKTDFIDSEGLCAMRGGICNSLSEPPPDMFDFSVENQSFEATNITQTTDIDIPMDTTPASEIGNTINDQESSVSSVEERKTDDVTLYTVNTTSPSTNTDDSCEIPLQPPIIAKPFEENGTSDSRFDEDKLATDGNV